MNPSKLSVATFLAVLAAEIILFWLLDLPEGTPRFVAAGVVVVSAVGMYWWARRKPNLNGRK
ncbi:hypothetical protein GCM10027048_27550 [Hymenobacter coalescens]